MSHTLTWCGLILFVLLHLKCFADVGKKERKKFVPTNEWQQIDEDDVLPPNLHYRINLETGIKEAKLLESEARGDSNAVAETVNGGEESYDKIEDSGVKQIDFKEVKDRVKEIKQRFRSIDELKKDFEALNLNPKSESQVVKDLLSKYNESSLNEKLRVLEDIEFHVHQVDVAFDFVKMGAFQLLLPDLNSTESSLRALVALTLGSAMQNNIKVQVAAMQENALDPLLRIISFDSSITVKSRAMYAVSCLIRQFPFAQKSFIKKGGISVLATLFKEKSLEMDKLKMKSVNLLHDILVEQKQAMSEKSSETNERNKQYEDVKLIENLHSAGFCELIPSMLNHTEVEVKIQVLSLMNLLFDVCSEYFEANLKHLPFTDDSGRFKEFKKLESNLFHKIKLKTETINKTEL